LPLSCYSCCTAASAGGFKIFAILRSRAAIPFVI
jgi:hypothetical protein